MTSFIVTEKTAHMVTHVRRIEAEDEDEALDIFNEGDGEDLGFLLEMELEHASEGPVAQPETPELVPANLYVQQREDPVLLNLLQDAYTMIRDGLVYGWPIRELHKSPETLLSEIEAAHPDLDKGDH